MKSKWIYLFHSLLLTFTTFRPQKKIWHGGTQYGVRAESSFCDAWQSSARDTFGLASSLLSNHLIEQEESTCDNRFIVLCIEVVSKSSRSKRSIER